jgi:hypothetical protein
MKISFVDFVPGILEDNTLYISIKYSTCSHLCPCGCSSKVITPLTPLKWSLIYNKSVSLYPSIGNWHLPCKSHYWIKDNRFVWASELSSDEISDTRKIENLEVDSYFDKQESLFLRLKRFITVW